MDAGEWNRLPARPLRCILNIIYQSCIQYEGHAAAKLNIPSHYCSLRAPCNLVKKAFYPFYFAGEVSRSWKSALETFLRHWKGENGCGFFAQVEDVYYPNPRYINARVREGALLGRWRVVRTLHTDEDDRGVFEVLDYRSPAGCTGRERMIVKAWTNPDDDERVVECKIYTHLSSNSVKGIPSVSASEYDNKCDVYVLAMEKLGPSLDCLLELIPEGRLGEKMVFALAIQLIDRYESLHKAMTVHNGVKPGNICLSGSRKTPSSIYIIDFGFSYILTLERRTGHFPMPSESWNAVVGNRQFLSSLGHLGIAQSQRDDLESLGYLFSFLYHGNLPWFPVINAQHGKLTTVPSIWSIKMGTPSSVLFRDMDIVFLEFWKDVKSLAFGEAPDYAKLRARFVASWIEHGWEESPGEIDWLNIYSDLEAQELDRIQKRQRRFRQALGLDRTPQTETH